MGDFGAVSKFRVHLVHGEGDEDRVVVQIGLDGLKIQDASSGRTMKSFELGNISRWNCRGGNLLLYTKTDSDVEERQLVLQIRTPLVETYSHWCTSSSKDRTGKEVIDIVRLQIHTPLVETYSLVYLENGDQDTDMLVGVLCLDPESGSDTISVVMLSPHSSMPILQAQLRMPVSELEEE